MANYDYENDTISVWKDGEWVTVKRWKFKPGDTVYATYWPKTIVTGTIIKANWFTENHCDWLIDFGDKEGWVPENRIHRSFGDARADLLHDLHKVIEDRKLELMQLKTAFSKVTNYEAPKSGVHSPVSEPENH